MSQAQSTPRTTAPGSGAGRWLAAHAQADCGNPSAQDRAFIALQNAYRPHRGLLRQHSTAVDGVCRPDAPDNDIEDLVAVGVLFGFPWHDAVWIPMFQIDMPGLKVATGPQRVLAELGCGFDGWALASWFVQPNSWLASHSPIECLASRLPDVLEAARADRFLTTG